MGSKKFDSQGHYGKTINNIQKEMEASRSTVSRWIFGEEDQIGLRDISFVHAVKDEDSKTAPWFVYKNPSKSSNKQNKACSVTQTHMNNDFLKPIDKKEIIKSICFLFINRGSYSDVNVNDVIETFKKYPDDIETEEDILKVVELVKNGLHYTDTSPEENEHA